MTERFGLAKALAYARRLEDAAKGVVSALYAIGAAGILDMLSADPSFVTGTTMLFDC